MSKLLKAGDVVRVKRSIYNGNGNNNYDAFIVRSDNFGVIKRVNSSSISVEWEYSQDEFWDCEGLCKTKHGWNVELGTIELYNQTSISTQTLIKLTIKTDEV